jgi:hypothetical protein
MVRKGHMVGKVRMDRKVLEGHKDHMGHSVCSMVLERMDNKVQTRVLHKERQADKLYKDRKAHKDRLAW